MKQEANKAVRQNCVVFVSGIRIKAVGVSRYPSAGVRTAG